MPLRNTTTEDIEKIIWKNIITRYGIPKILVSDNGPQFDVSLLRDKCKRLGIEHRFAPVCYPQANGQLEVMNRTIFQGIKKNLFESGERWMRNFPKQVQKSDSTNFFLDCDTCQHLEGSCLIDSLYRIRKVIGPGTYELEELSGKATKHTWHGIYLKKYYV
ncbi:hypothetical protein LIER_24369 [Lithospermum erythrorhizon]|uniref:Integrase catalytic domain-containing protein n=1 Tax=Lithospermum erythrorhizon TaxID=34254 RepID=A0AAV3R423_LITER